MHLQTIVYQVANFCIILNIHQFFRSIILLILCPLLTLFQYDVHGTLCFLWWVLVFLQQSLYQTAHVGTFRLSSIPVDGAISSEHIS